MDSLISDEEFKIVFDSSDVSHFLVTIEGDNNFRFRRVNESFLQLTGLDKEKIQDKSPREVFADDAGERLAEHFQSCVEQKSELTFNEKIKLPAGNKNLSVKLNPISSKERIVRIVGTVRPLSRSTEKTEGKDKRKQIEQLQKQNSSAGSSGLNGIALADETGEIFYVNDDFVRIFGLKDKEEALGKHPLDLAPGSGADKSDEFLELVKSEGLSKREIRELKNRGKVFDVEFNLSSVQKESENISCTMVSLEDIEETKQEEMELSLARTSVENAPLGILWLTSNGKFEYVNNKACEMLGFSRKELIGKKISEIDPEYSAKARNQRWQKMKNNKTARHETQFMTKDEEYFPVEVTGHYTQYNNNEYEIAFVRELTEQKKREHELNQLTAAIKQNPAMVMITDINGKIEYVNPKFTELTGYEAEEVKGKKTGILKSGHHPEEFYSQMWETLLNGEVFQGELLNQTKAGEEYWEKASIAPLKDEKGQIINFIKVAEDITAKRKMRRSLEELNRCFLNFTANPDENFDRLLEVCGQLLDSEAAFFSPVRGASVDCRAWNTAGGFENICESFEEISNKLINDNQREIQIINNLSKSRFAETNPEIKKHNLSFYAGKVIHCDDKPVGVLAVVFAKDRELTDNDKSVFNISASALESEVSRYRLQEELKASNSQLKQFANMAAHDLKDPLLTVISYLNMLKRKHSEQLAEGAIDFIDQARSRSHHMIELLEGLLEFSKVETGEKNFEPVKISEIIAEVLADLETQIEENQAQVNFEELPVVQGDSALLARVFQNLISNALTYRGNEPPEIEITAESQGNRVIISVADNGIGMKPEETEKIFSLFQRLHKDEEIKGTGLGLALCKKIISQHGGEIWAESSPGEGTTFKMDLPLK